MKNFASLIILAFSFGGLFAQAPFPFFDNFDASDLNPDYWTPRPNLEGTDGVVDRASGVGLNNTSGIRIGKTQDGSFTTNALDLSIDLSGQTQVELTFWIRDYYDITNDEDGVFFSDNGGTSFVKVLAFRPDEWCDERYGQHPPLDVDELALNAGLSLTSQFVIRFQQRGESDFGGGSTSEDGFNLDDINVYNPGLVYHDLSQEEFFDDFETGLLGESWAWNFADLTSSVNTVSAVTSPMGIVEIQDFIGVDQTKGIAMGRRCDGVFTVNALDLHLDLSNLTDVEMTFWIRDYYDATDDDDGIYFSDNGGVSFTKVLDFFPDEWCNETYGKHPPIDVDGLAEAAGLSLTSQFIIRFQQRGENDFGGGTTSEDGFNIDNVNVYDPGLTFYDLSQGEFFDDFENPPFGSSWAWNFADATSTAGAGSAAITSPMNIVEIQDFVGVDQTKGVAMGRRCDGNGVFTTNALDLHLNLSNQTNVEMSFFLRGENENIADDDGIFFSNNGGDTFTKVFEFTDPLENSYDSIHLSISDLAITNNIAFSNEFIVRFQQRGENDFGGGTTSEDGIYLDNVNVTGTTSNCNLSLSTTNLINAGCSEPTGEVTIVPSGGIPTYSYNLSGPTPGTIQNDGAGVFTDLAPGSYTANVLDLEECTASVDFVIGNDGAVTATSINTVVNDLTVDFSFDTSILGDVDDILWDFGDGTTSTDTLPTHTYAAEGTYIVTLTLNSIECGPGVTQGSVTVTGGGTTAPAPEAGFEPSTTLGCAPLTVTFENTSVNAVAYQWVIDGVTPSLYTTEDPGAITFTQPGVYTVRLQAENADGVEDVTEVTIEVQDVPVADFDAQLFGSVASFTNNSYPDLGLIDQISWDFGDGNTSTSANPVHIFSTPGIYTITLTLTNECGSDEVAKSVTVEPNAGQVALDVGENMGFEGQVVPVPVILREYTGTLAALQGTLRFETAGVGEFQGFSGNLISTGNIQFNDANGQFSALIPNGLQASGGADTLFFVNVLLSGNPGDSTDIFIDDDPNIFTRLEVTIFENGVIGTIDNILLIDGQVKIFESADLDGLIYFWEDLSPINLVDVNLDLAGTPIDPDLMQTTGPDGTYFFDNVDAGQDVEIYCVKETNPVNGVTTGPLFLVQQYTVFGPGPVGQYNSPYQMVASDSDCNETINAADIIRVQQVIVGNPNVDLCKSWTFVPEYYSELTGFNMDNQGFVLTYPEEVTVDQIQDDTTFNFVGVKVGDILGNADPSSLMDDDPIELRNSASVKLQLADRAVQAGDFFELAFTSGDFQNMGGLQLALEYAADELEFHGFAEASQAIQPQFYHDEEAGSLRMSWVDPSATGLSLNEDTPVLTLRFKALNTINAISDLLWINTNSMRAEATDVNLGQYQVELEWEALTDNPVAGQQAGYYLYQNMPNPAKEETRIKFALPFAQRATLDLIDPLGRVVASYEQLFPQGFSELNISTQQLQSGLYQYRLRTEAYTEAKTMMIVR